MQLSFILEFFTQHCQQGWLLPCSRFSVSQNFCSSLKYLSRMYTFDVPIPAILTTGGHHWLSSALPISPYAGELGPNLSGGLNLFFCCLTSWRLLCRPAGPRLAAHRWVGPRHRAKTQLWHSAPMYQCTQCTRHRLVRTTLVHCGTTWVHVTRQPAVVGGSR